MQLSSLSIRLYNILKKNKVFLLYIPLTVYWILLFVFTSIPTDTVPKFFGTQDKVEHFGAYFLLSVLLCLTLHFQKKNPGLSNRAVFVTFILIIIYGALDELHQLLVPGRSGEVLDWIADALGGGCGIWLCRWFLKSSGDKNYEKLPHL